MGKSYKERKHRDDESYDVTGDETCYVSLQDIHISEETVAKLMHRDFHQIDLMRQTLESGGRLVRVVLKRRFGGGYHIEDGRHRVIAANLADTGFIEAKIVGK